MTWWGWLLIGLATWVALAVPLGIVVGRVIRGADATAACGTCGHGREAHAHYREGSDCALCDCPRFRAARRAPSPLPQPRTHRVDEQRRRAG